jgi:3-hydroxybutyryl-CoA dehydrogenase
MTEAIKQVGVVGLGVMGFDIAFLYSMNGFQTLVHDASKLVMEGLVNRREQTIERLERRSRISDSEAENVRKLMSPAAEVAGLASADLITEAVLENAQTKLAVYQGLRAAGFRGILTTNTSSLTRATLLAGGAYDRAKFITTHFFNPVLYTKMVEVVKGDAEDRSIATVLSFLESLGRDPVETHDISGFVSNSILMVYAVMALQLLECGARIDVVDQTAKAMGLLPPFISFDSWKPSIVEDVTQIMCDLRGDPFLRSSKLLSALAKDNPKFYIDQKPNLEIYQRVQPRTGNSDEASIKRALKLATWISAARTVELGESPTIVDFIATEGIKFSQAPFREIDSLGAATVLQELSAFSREMPSIPLTSPSLLTAMAGDRETFYKNQQPNPWLLSRVKQ